MERRKTERKILECKKCHWKGKYILAHLQKEQCRKAYTMEEINIMKRDVALLKINSDKARYNLWKQKSE